MANEVEISVLVPCYNVEKYVGQCLDSIVNQTFKDLEIICINDGSTDHTLEILNKYAASDSRVKIIDKPNSGYGASMNIGLKAAKGRYIGIVESDDWIAPHMYDVLHMEVEDHDLDIARCLFLTYNEIEDRQILSCISGYSYNETFSPSDRQHIFFTQPSIWATLYKKEFLNVNNIDFLETPGASYQDAAFTIKVFACATKVRVVPMALHNYRVNSNSSVNSPSKVFCVCDEYDEMLRFTKEHGIYEHLKEAINYRAFWMFRWNYERLGEMRLKRMFLPRWSKYSRAMFKDGSATRRYFSANRKFRLWLLAYFPCLYYFKRKF